MNVVRPGCRWLLACALCAGATGCHKRAPVPPPPVAPTTTVALTQAPEPDKPPLVQTVPVVPTPLPSKPVQPVRLKKVHKKAADTQTAVAAAPAVTVAPASAPPPPPANQVASAGNAPADSVIGSLSAGGEAAPAEKQKAVDEIVQVEKRLGALSQSTLDNQKEGLVRVRSFLRQAHEALNTGDADGASTLATKAGVLLDDLLK